MLPNYMNMGNDWKNRRPPMLAGETLGSGAEHPRCHQQGDQSFRNSALHLGLSETAQVLH